MKKKNVTVSSVPVPVLNTLGQVVWDWVAKPKDYTVANAFAVVSSTETLPDIVDPKSKLAMDVLQDPITMLPTGVSRVVYSSNCTAILGAALGADANVSFPIAKLSATVKADYQSSDTGELGMIVGVFNSPFLQLYNGLLSRDSAVFAHLALWDWYRNKYSTATSIAPDKYYVLSWFNGVSLYKVNKESRQTDGSVNMSASASYLSLASVTSSLTAQYKNYGAINVNNYKFAAFAFKDSPRSKFEQLDAPDQIISWAKQNAFAVLDSKSFGSNNILRQGYPEVHSQVINGVPEELCNHNFWTPNPSAFAKVGTLSVTGETFVAISAAQAVPGCSLTLTFKPDDALFTGASTGNIDLVYSLDSKVADKTLEITAARVPLQTSSLPLLTPSSVGPVNFGSPTSSGSGYVLEWNLKASVQDDPANAIDTSAPITIVSGPSFDGCHASAQNILIPSDGIVLDTKHHLSIKVQQYISINTKPDPTAKDNVSCTVNLTLQFKTQGGHFVNRALPGTQFAYPNLATPPKFQIMATPALKP